MSHHKDHKDTPPADVKKQNQDLPNIPASSQKIHSEETAEKEIKETSKLHNDGKTENEEKNEN